MGVRHFRCWERHEVGHESEGGRCYFELESLE